MGCDIHAAVEKRVGDKWVMVDRLHWENNKKTISRNYGRFALLAGVRGPGPEPRGIPDDISESTKLFIDEWGEDGHSHSWLPIRDAAAIWLATDPNPSEYGLKYPWETYFDVEEEKLDLYRVIFWFDN